MGVKIEKAANELRLNQATRKEVRYLLGWVRFSRGHASRWCSLMHKTLRQFDGLGDRLRRCNACELDYLTDCKPVVAVLETFDSCLNNLKMIDKYRARARKLIRLGHGLVQRHEAPRNRPPPTAKRDTTPVGGRATLKPRLDLPLVAGQLYPARVRQRVGAIDSQGRLVLKPTFEPQSLLSLPRPVMRWVSDGLAPLNVGNRVGFIDTHGRMKIAAKYGVAWPFSEGFARALRPDGRGVFIRPDGSELRSTTWSAAGDFSDGLAVVQVTTARFRRFSVIDRRGRLVLPADYLAIGLHKGGAMGTTPSLTSPAAASGS